MARKGTQLLRKTSECTKKQVAAGQRWTCGHCSRILSSSFEVDHTIPLWKGGADAVGNLQALCSNCHSQKSQKESQERAEEKRTRMINTRLSYEEDVKRDEEAKRKVKPHPRGTVQCMECKCRYYSIFQHNCIKVRERVEARIGRPPAAVPLGRVFEEFYYYG